MLFYRLCALYFVVLFVAVIIMDVLGQDLNPINGSFLMVIAYLIYTCEYQAQRIKRGLPEM